MTAARPHTVVVGGTHGIGRAVVRRFLADGHLVSVVGRREPPEAEHDAVVLHRADLADPARLGELPVELVDAGGPLANLVFLQRARGGDDEWRSELEVSVEATRTLIEALQGSFAPHGGSIVIVSSHASRLVADEQPLGYHVGKAALTQIARYYAVRLGPVGIRVNSVSPAAVVKEEAREWYDRHPEASAGFRRSAPLRRMGTPEDVAGAIAFLCGADAGYVTGHDLAVDGGLAALMQETLLRVPPEGGTR